MSALAVARLGAGAGLARRTLGETGALAQVGLGTAVVVAAAQRPSPLTSVHRGAFSPWFAGPLEGLAPSVTRNPAVLTTDLHHVLLAMLAAWVIVVLCGAAVRPAVAVGAVVALNGVFLFCPPFALTDLFNYLGYARLDALHHLNPYVQPPLAQARDPVLAYSNWHRLLSPYGPLFTLLMLPVGRLRLPDAYWTYKLLATAASLGLVAAVWACARRLGRPPAAAVAFVGLNPLVLVYALGGKHNDLLTMAALLAGGLLMLRRREVAGGAVLAAAVALKASAGLLAPVVALGAPRRPRALAGLAAGGLALAGATYLAFGPHLPDLRDQSRLVNTYSVPNLVGYAAGHGGADAPVRRAATAAMVAGVAVCGAAAWRTRRWAGPAGWAGLVAIAAAPWLMAWYLLWALPFAALSGSRALRAATLLAAVWMALIWAGQVPTYAREHGVHPRATAVGRANHAFELSLLEDPPKEMRAPGLGTRRMLPRPRGSVPSSGRRGVLRRPHPGARHRAGRAGRRAARRVDAGLAARRPHRDGLRAGRRL